MVLANNAVDRTYERFPVPVLERFAQTLPGKSLLITHDKRQPASGLIYDARVRTALPGEAGTHSLVASFYVVRTPDSEGLRQHIDGGVRRHVSIGFRYDQRLCDVCCNDCYNCVLFPGGVLDWCGPRARRLEKTQWESVHCLAGEPRARIGALRRRSAGSDVPARPADGKAT